MAEDTTADWLFGPPNPDPDTVLYVRLTTEPVEPTEAAWADQSPMTYSSHWTRPASGEIVSHSLIFWDVDDNTPALDNERHRHSVDYIEQALADDGFNGVIDTERAHP